MTEMINPYIAGAPVVETRMFFGREDVFDWIQNSLTGRYADHTLVIHGQRRVGKTSVLKQLGNRLPKKYIPVFFDLQGRTHTTLDRFLWWLAREIVRVLKQERDITFPVPEKEVFTQDIEYFEHRFLPDLRTVLGDNVLLLTFDEFDNLEENEIKEELSIPLVDYLRRLMGQEGLNFIFSIGSSGRKLENMQASYTAFFKTALYKKISFLSRDQSASLITRPVEGLLEYSPQAVDRIYDITSGHPYFTQLICHELFSACQQTRELSIQEKDVEAVLEDVIERGTVNLKFVWDEASDIEKWSLASLAHLEGKADTPALAAFLRKQRLRFSESDLTSGLLRLREKDILTKENRFVIYLLKLWLKKNRPLEQVREELTEVNPIANRFIEIGLEFQDGGQFEKAIENFREALAVAPEHVQAQGNIAMAYMAQKAYDKAILEFEKALTMDDEDVSARSGLCEAHLALGDAAMTKGRAKEATLSYQRVLTINAEHLEARQRMAELSRQRAEKALTDGKDEEALSAFTEALKFTPEDQSLLARSEKVRAEKNAKVLAGQIARSEKDTNARNWDKAIATLNDALDIAPGDESILKKIKSIQEKQLRERLDVILAKVEAAEKANRWDAAIAALNDYLQLKPDDTAIQKRIADLMEAKHATWLDAITGRVDQAVATQNWDEALTALNEALRLEPDNAEMQAKAIRVGEARRIAELNLMLKRLDQVASAGRWDEAINILNDGLASDPDNKTLQTKLAEARKAKREARLQAALRFADSAVQTGKWESATASLQEILANEPDNPVFQEKLAEIKRLERESKLNALQTQAQNLLQAEKFEESLAAWNAYLALEPEDLEKAREEIEAVKKVQNLASLYSEATGEYAKKNYEKAIDLFKGIVVEDADYKDATDLLAESVRLRRSVHKASRTGGRRIWVTGGLLAILALGIGGAVFWLGKNSLPAISGLFTNNTATPTTAALSKLTPTPTGKTITVTSAQDSGAGTLRQALMDAQAGDTITVDTQVFPPGRPTTIFLTSETLPRISQGGITIDASNAGVILDGSKLQGGDVFGLVINSDHNTVMGLQIINTSGSGIYLEGGSYNTIGGDRTIGTGPLGQGNLLSNNFVGIGLLSKAGGNVITGNLIGTGVSGAGTMGNWKSGIYIEDNQSYNPAPNTIGPDNVIAYNGTTESVQAGEITGGVVIDTVLSPIIITANSIYDNTGSGIFYNVDDAVRIKYSTPPVILYFDLDAGKIDGQTCKECIVEIFSTDTQDGKIYEGTVTADEYGNFSFSAGRALSGPFLTATTRPLGDNTSEFSPPTPARSAIQIALDAIQNEAPVYQTGFDTWDFGEPVDYARIENGKLVATSESQDVNVVDLHNYSSDMFAVEFEFRNLDSSPEGHCVFNYNNLNVGVGESMRGVSAVFSQTGLVELGHYVHPDQFPTIASSRYDMMLDGKKANTVTMIILGEQIAVFSNGQLAYTALNPDGRVVNTTYNFQVSNTICEYDNYKFWDLSGVDFSASTLLTTLVPNFADPILAAIKDREPDFQDEFSGNSEGWLSNHPTIESGVLRESNNSSITNSYFLNKPNFVLQVDISPPPTCCVLVKVSSNNSIYLSPDSWGICRPHWSDCNGYLRSWSEITKVQIMVIVKGTQAGFYLNGIPVAYIDDSYLGVGEASFTCSDSTCEFDNVKFWDLDKIPDLP